MLKFPHFTVLKASAGSGKTYALSTRFAAFLLSDSVPKNRLGNLLAITFSNNAAQEMKRRVLDLLKRACLGDKELVGVLGALADLPPSRLMARAEETIDTILANYGDFQVRTIDSFMTSVFKASAIDFGYSPDFEIVMDNSGLMGYAFDLFLRKVREGTKESVFMKGIIDAMLGNRKGDTPYPWDPAKEILAGIAGLHAKLAAYGKPVSTTDWSAELKRVKERIEAAVDEIEIAIRESGLARRATSSYEGLRTAVKSGRFPDLVEKGMKLAPVCRPERHGNHEAYEEVLEKWHGLSDLITEYARLYACSYYAPYLKTFEGFSGVLERAKRHEGKVFIEDINKKLAEYLGTERVPDVYLRLGDVIYHYLIDEFQDTSPIQWQNLLPLLDNSLSQGGSLFVVGDTKQAIYGFREADYTIMKGVERRNAFPSAIHMVEELHTNYRSDEAVVAFTEHVFQRVVPEREELREAACETGLTDYRQGVREDRIGRGYVQTCLLERNDSEPQERNKLYELIETLLGRGYQYSDITILSSKNSDVVRITTWLNARGIPFLSYSSLDVRKRKITGEIVALLNFLDSPLDNLSFAGFILGDIFDAVLKDQGRATERDALHDFCFRQREAGSGPLYKAFQAEMGDLWSAYFERLFRSSGYLPIYDLICEIYAVFDVFRLFGKTEEAVLTKILEVVRDLEANDGSSLRTFLRFAAASESADADWNVNIPRGIDAVNVMTIHKSKGLGFPVVILVLYGERTKGHPYIVHDNGDTVSLLRLTKAVAARDEGFEKRYKDEEMKERVNRLNSLYVAFTRAGSELYVIGVKRERDSFPFAIFPQGMTYSNGEAAEVPARPEHTAASIDACHLSAPFECGPGSDETIRFEEKRRGEVVHKMFSSIEYVGPAMREKLAECARALHRTTGIDDEVLDGLVTLIVDFLGNSSVSEYYEPKPGRKVLVEQELVDSEGRLFRVDRMVVDTDRVTVVEYKTGGDREGERSHLAQMRNYLRIVRDLYPDRPVEGAIGYVDLKKTKHVDLPVGEHVSEET
jgi:ATP-dependent helicase/nuclease subunit A